MSNPRNLKRALIGLTLVAAQVVALPMVGAQSPVQAAAAMTVAKSAVPAPGTTVKMGDTITYSVAVSNTSTAGETLTGLTVNDLVPAGTTYVPSSATITGARKYLQFRDEFNAELYTNNNGTTNWTSNWVETGDGNPGTPTGGDIKFVDDGSTTDGREYVLQIDEPNRSIARSYSLSVCATGTATLSFDWKKDEDLNGTVSVEVQNATTMAWSPITSFTGAKTSAYATFTSTPAQSAAIIAGSQVRFSTDGTNNKKLFFDNVQIARSCEVVAPNTPVSAPPSLVAPPAQSYSLNAGETATVTFQVTVAGTTTSVSNTATASSRQVTTVTSNAVTHNVELATITKSSSPASGSNVLQGSTITYNVAVKNIGGTPLTDLQIADALPAGVTYVPGSAKISGARTFVQYLDQFTAQTYSNSDGITSWTSTPWVETVDGNSPTGGDIEIKNDNEVSPERINVLYVKGKDGRTIRRPMNLGACATGTPTLSFEWRRKDDLTGGKEVYLDFSTNGTTWVQQAVFSGAQTTTYATYSQLIPAQFRVAGAQLRFRSSTTNDKLLYVDNVKIEGMCDVITPLTNAAAPPNLVLASSHYAVAPNETATVTFNATVNTLGSGVSTLVLNNFATAAFAGIPTITSNTVTHTVVTLPSFKGTVYFDRDNNGSLNTGDPAVGAPMWAKLVPASGNAIKAAIVDPATGTYTIPLVSAGTYSVIIDDNSTLSDTTPTAPATWSNATPATGSRTGVVSAGDGAVDVTGLNFGLTRSADLELTKTVSAPTAYVGGSVTYTLSLTNNGPQPTANVVVTDLLPAGLTYVSQSGTGTYVPATGKWTVPNVASGQTVTLTILASVSGPLTVNSVVTNSAEVTDSLSFDPDSTPGNNSTTEDDDAAAAFTVVAPPTAEVAVTKTVDVTNAGVGDVVAYTITVKNNGPDAISGGVLNDVLPASLGFQTYSTTPLNSGVYNPTAGTWNFGALANGQTRTLRINAKVLAVTSPSGPLTVTNTASVDVAPVVDPTPGNNSASATFALPYADLSLVKKIDGLDQITAPVNSSHVFTLTLTNAGPDTVQNVVVEDLLQGDKFLFNSATASAGTYSPGSGLWTIPTMAPGTATLTINVTLPTGGQHVNTAELISVNAIDPDSSPGNRNFTEDDIDQVTVTVTNGDGTVVPGLPGSTCFPIADNGAASGTGGGDLLTRVDRNTGAQQEITIGAPAGTGTSNIESSAMDPVTGAIYTADGGNFGQIDLLTGKFTSIGPAAIGTGSGFRTVGGGNYGTLPFNDIDGMHFDATTGFLYASVRREGATPNPEDLLIRINPATGVFVPNAFNTDNNTNTVEDFVLIRSVNSGGARNDIDALGVDLDGTLYGIANSGGTGDQVLIVIDKLTGATTIAGVLYRPSPFQDSKMTDVEGMSFDLQGRLYVTTGTNGFENSGFYDMDKTPVNGRINAVAYTDMSALGNDYEAVTCGVPPTDVAVTKSVSNPTPAPGSNITYTVTVTDNGPTIATGIRVDDVLPAGLTYVSHVASLGTFTPGTGQWSIGGLNVGGVATLSIVATVGVGVPSGTPIVNTAAIPLRLPGIAWMDQPDSDLTNNSDDATIFVGVSLADIRGTVFDDLDGDDSISAGDGTIAGVLIELFRDDDNDGIPDGDAIATTRTLGDGTYVFEDLPNGTYLVRETDPPSHASVSDIDGPNDNNIEVVLAGNGVDSNGNDFLEVALDYGDAPVTYGTASAKISPLLSLGAAVTPDEDGRYDDADADDGVSFSNAAVTTTGYTLPVTVTNTTGESVWVCGWIDTDADAEDRGTFETSERQCVEVEAEDGVDEYTASLTWTGVGGLNGSSFARFRVAPTLLEAQAASGTSGIGEVEDYPINLATLPVTVAYFSSTKSGKTIDVTWWSGTESANAGYVIYGEKPNGKKIALTDIIVGAGDSFVPLEYRQSVSGNYTTLWLADVDLLGVETLHGPYRVGEAVGTVPAPVALDWKPAQAQVVASNQTAEAERVTAQNQATATAVANADGRRRVKVSRVVGIGNSAALSVETDGIYRVSFDDLMAAGMDWTGVKMKTLAVIDASGDPVPVRVKGAGKFTTGKFVEFWADSIDTLYTGTNVYRLVVDPSQRLLMDVDKSKVPKAKISAATSSMHTVVVEQQKLYSTSMPGSDPWFAQRLFSFGAPATTIVDVDHVAPGRASVAVTVAGGVDFAVAEDHHVTVSVNGVTAGEVRFGGITEKVVTGTVPSGVLVDGANNVTVTVTAAAGAPYGLVNLDRISVTYPRRIVAVDGTAEFTASSARVSVAGFTSPQVEVLRFQGDDIARVARKRAALQSDGTYTISFAGNGTAARYAVTQIGSIDRPEIAAGRKTTGLLTGTADLLIISHSAFSDHLGDLVAAREAQGLSVKVVEVEDVYAAYTGEVFDPAAISAYIADAATAFDDPAILLVGADSYDYRNYVSADSIAFIPTLYGNVGVGQVRWSPIDPAFADIDNDQVPDLALGRFPVRNLDELTNAIAKATSYTPDASAVFASDTGFGATTDEIAASLPSGYAVTTAALDDFPVADARSALLGGINGGAGLTVFFGHSSTDQWTSKGLLRTADVAGFTNTDDPTLVVQFGCWNTYFSHPTQQSLGSRMLTAPTGAAAVVGATTLTSSIHDAMFGPNVMDGITSSATIGEALLTAKHSLRSVTSAPDITLGWTLLGDPTTPID